MPRALLLAPLVAMSLAGRARAQLVVQGIRDLAFGPVLQGVQAVVTPTDPVKSGQFYLRTPGLGSRIRIRFTLPNRLNGPAGATMRIRFRNNDAMVKGTAPFSPPVFFNPNRNSTFRMTTSADANVWLGGRVNPSANQRVGRYSATVVMTVTVF